MQGVEAQQTDRIQHVFVVSFNSCAARWVWIFPILLTGGPMFPFVSLGGVIGAIEPKPLGRSLVLLPSDVSGTVASSEPR